VIPFGGEAGVTVSTLSGRVRWTELTRGNSASPTAYLGRTELNRDHSGLFG
jgi:hypothetical protein